MGNHQSGKEARKEENDSENQNEDDNLVQDIITTSKYSAMWKINEKHKTILRDDWNILRSGLESVGVVTFLNLFETHPETLRPFIHDVYTMKELELNEWYREKLKVHALRVMSVVEKTLHRVDNEVKAGQILVPYGRRHRNYGVTPEMLDVMSFSFIVAIQPTLEEKESWNREHEEAWHAIFKFITFFLKLGFGGLELIDKEELRLTEENFAKQNVNDENETS